MKEEVSAIRQREAHYRRGNVRYRNVTGTDGKCVILK